VLTSAGPTQEEFVKQRADVTFSRVGYASCQVPGFRLIGSSYTFKTSLMPLTKGALTQAGRGVVPTETETSPHGFFDKTGAEPEPIQDRQAAAPAPGQTVSRVSAVTVPASIRVGTNCSCNSCSNVTVLSLESYVRSGLDNEWISSWGANSLKAGAIAYRSYGAYHVSNPIASNFDISSTTCRQVWDGTEVASTRNAANDTQGMVLVKNGAIAFTEYSSENNNAGCGNGYAGTNTTGAPCISDPLCSGRATFGHGRGMCQYGSSFWHTNGKTYLWIIDHYSPVGISLQSPVAADAQAPTTTIAGPASASANFTATFTDADNVGVAARFYQPLEWRTDEWRANRGNGFYNDNFGNAALHSDYVPGLADWQGTWTETTAGTLRQSSVTPTNTALSTFLSQTAGNTYLYNFAARILGDDLTRTGRFGLHIMASDATVRERGNSYLIWFANDDQKVRIIETINNVLTERAVGDAVVSAGEFADYKVSYDTSTGEVRVYQNSRLVVSWTDATPLTTGSYLSLRTNQAQVEFDDLKVYKSRGTSRVITVGPANSKDLRRASPNSTTPAGKIKSLVRDAAGNWSAAGNLDLIINQPAARAAAPEFQAEFYPNPAEAKTTLAYELPAAGSVSVVVLDGRGKKLLTLLKAPQEAGPHELALTPLAELRPGTYFVRIEAGKHSSVRRVVKL
jgi:hypothetical protein